MLVSPLLCPESKCDFLLLLLSSLISSFIAFLARYTLDVTIVNSLLALYNNYVSCLH